MGAENSLEPMMQTWPECFDDAVRRFDAFLGENGHEGEIAWLFSGDVTSRGRNAWVRWPVPEKNLERAKRLYEEGKARDGVRLHAFCQVGDAIGARLELPHPDDPETGRIACGLVLVVASTLPIARPIRSRLRWRWLVWRNGLARCKGIAALLQEEEA